MNPSLTALRYVAAVVEHGSFSAAARACAVSQPTVSNAVADLEESLGARLFERSTKRLALTPAGTKLVPLVQGVLEAVAELARGSSALKSPSQKLLRIGFTSLLGAQRIALLFEPFSAQFPGLEIVYKECTHGDMQDRLDANALDFVCGTRLAKRSNRGRQVLYSEALRFVPPNGVGGDRASVSLRDAARTRLLLTTGSCGLAPATRELFSRAHLSIQEYAGQAISYAALEEWAGLGIGGALITESNIRRAPSVPLVEGRKPVKLSYEVIWRKDLLVARHTLDFVRYLRTVVPELVRGSTRPRSHV